MTAISEELSGWENRFGLIDDSEIVTPHHGGPSA
jgi:hypothetical protein